MKKALALTVALLLGLTGSLWASDLVQTHSELYPYRNTIEVQDDFLTGLNTTGNISMFGWFLSNGTVTQQPGEANRPGIFRLDSTAVNGTIASLNFGATGAEFDPSVPTIVLFVARLNTNDANTTHRIGSGNSTVASPPADGIYIEKLDADATWFCVTRAGGVQTRTNSTIAINTNFNTFAYTRNSSGVQFSINNVNVCGVHTTNIPTVFLRPTSQIVNSAAASKTIDHDYFHLIISGITR